MNPRRLSVKKSVGGLTSRGQPEKSQKVSGSHRNDVSPLIPGLRYRAACDIDFVNGGLIIKSCAKLGYVAF